ncbi:TetR family transcriptional regulator [Mycolicibacterium setense]|nr:TetR family transcriptional regulator [Mycolicibacterium setense]
MEACRGLIRSGADLSMPAVAQLASVSEATAYRHFADLVSLVAAALAGLWPDADVALEAVAESSDPVERIGFACEFLLRGVHKYQGAVRSVIAATVTNPEQVPHRPGFRFGLIDAALDPVIAIPDSDSAASLTQLKCDLAAVVSAEALFSLTDLCGLPINAAIASLVRTAQTVTRAAIQTDLVLFGGGAGNESQSES